MKIATWNVNSLRVRLDQVLEWLRTEQVDVLAMQEIKLVDADFPHDAFKDVGYYALCAGQKTYNGVALLTRDECVENVITDLTTETMDPQRRVLTATWKNYRIINLYIPNGEALGTEKYEYKLRWLKYCQHFLAQELKNHEKVIVLGDFNIAPSDQDISAPKNWENSVFVSEPERTAFDEFLKLGFVDAYRMLMPESKELTWWDYRAGSFRRNIGLRIDLILVSDALKEKCRHCWIDKNMRGVERPSDHAPVVVEIAD